MDHFKKCNVDVTGIPEGKENRAKGIFEVVMAERVSKWKIPSNRPKKLREHQAGKMQKTTRGISYAHCRKLKTNRKS